VSAGVVALGVSADVESVDVESLGTESVDVESVGAVDEVSVVDGALLESLNSDAITDLRS